MKCGRNDKCPFGSNKKYKRCCGSVPTSSPISSELAPMAAFLGQDSGASCYLGLYPAPKIRVSKGTAPLEATRSTSAAEVIRWLPDGSYKIMKTPDRTNDWHSPKTYVPSHQWRATATPACSRYEWARRNTPDKQLPVFRELQRRYQTQPPLPLELPSPESAVLLPNGSLGASIEAMREYTRTSISLYSPDGKWGFTIHSDQDSHGVVVDVLMVSHSDYRTLPDWELMLRFCSWVLEDHRTAMSIMPGHLGRPTYANDQPNCLWLMSPRAAAVNE